MLFAIHFFVPLLALDISHCSVDNVENEKFNSIPKQSPRQRNKMIRNFNVMIDCNSDKHVRAFMPFYGIILLSGFGTGLKIKTSGVQFSQHIYVKVLGKLPIQYCICLLSGDVG